MYSIGQRLREERLRKGLKLADIAEQTRIRAAFLEAIEADQFDLLPGRFFARSFIRQYAHLLGLDDPELEAEIARQLGEPGPAVSAAQLLESIEESRPEKPPVLWRSHPSGRPLLYATIGLLSVAGILGLYLGWRQTRVRAELERMQAAAERPAASAPSPPRSGSAPAAENPAGSPSASRTEVSSAPATVGASPTENPAAAGAAIVAELTASENAWVQVVCDGKVSFVGTLKPGQSQTFRASQNVRILTGNAGGLQIRRNGQLIGPVGPPGQVRTVELTPEGHTITAPRPKTPESESPAQPESPSTGPPPAPDV